MKSEERSFDWRLPAVWAALLAVSVVAHTYVEMANPATGGRSASLGRALATEICSHIVVAALVPAIYWLHRRWPLGGAPRNLLVHVAAVVPFSLAHTLGMAALRLLWFAGILGENYAFPLTFERLSFEFAKDVVNFAMLSAAVLALRHLLRRPLALAPQPEAPPAQPAPLSERFAVRKRGKEIMVDVADIDWVEAAGNYAVLHVGGETLEIRSSLSKLEGELDPRRFVRVHKSYLVNIARIAEVTPWISGDWRIRLHDGAEVNLSRRYRQKFEALVAVKS